MKFLIRPQFKIRINYKSGNFIEAWFWKFITKAELGGRTYEWVNVQGNNPLYFNIAEIESVWQIDFRRWRLYMDDPKIIEKK